MSELNSRQWALYNFLKDKGDEWTHAKTIADAVYGFNGKRNFIGSTEQRQLSADIQAINNSSVIQKIILSDKAKGIKLANEKEINSFLVRNEAAALCKLKRLSILRHKAGRDLQMRLVFGSERDTVKAFIDSDKDFGERLKKARLDKGLTAKQVAALMKADGFHVDEPMISKFERGYCLPNKTTLAKFALIYGVSVKCLTASNLSTTIEESEINGLQVL